MTSDPAAKLRPERVLFSLLGDRRKASSRVRGYWIGDALQDMGHCVTYRVTKHRLDYLWLVRDAIRHDVVIFQKTHSRYAILAQRILRLIGKRVLFDIDDAPSIDRSSITHRNAMLMMRRSDAILAGSHNLAELARQTGTEVHFIPSGISLENYAVTDPQNDTVCLGWIGNGAQYARDLVAILRGPLSELAARHPLRLKIVGACGQQSLTDGFGDITGLTLDLVDDVDWADPQAISAAVADFDIGLYPLLETDFNIYKCAFKALEYMANGVPVVASNVGANGDVIADGVDGYLAESPEDWVTALGDLVGNPTKRAHMGAAGRTKIETRYSTKALARQIAKVL